MKSRITVFLACVIGLTFSGTASAVLIDFETDPGGNTITAEVPLLNQFASLGVTFSATENGAAVSPSIQAPAVFFGEPAFSGLNYADNQIAGFGPSDGTNRADVFTISFLSPAFGVSMYVDQKGSLSPTFNAYDAGNNLLESLSTSTNGWELLSFASMNISRIEGIQPSDSWNYGIDDLSFTLQDVPEPATVALMALGLAGIGYSRKRDAA
jgi:hypothetical protein